MTQKIGSHAAAPTFGRLGSPPIPHEHGAWVILYVSLIVGFGAAGVFAPLRWLLLFLTVTGIFLAREAVGLLIRSRGKEGMPFWAALYILLAAGGGIPLLFLAKPLPLGIIAGLMLLLFALHSILLKIPSRKRLDRSQGGEILGACALALAAPAAYAAARSTLDSHALLLWPGVWLYFSGGILYVKMWLAAAKHKTDWSPKSKRAVSAPCFLFHLFLTFALIGVCSRVGVLSAACLGIAFLPALYRAFRGCRILSNRLPSLKRVGLLESIFSAWFTLFFLFAMRFFLQ